MFIHTQDFPICFKLKALICGLKCFIFYKDFYCETAERKLWRKNVVRADKMCKIMTHIVIIIAWNFSLMDQTRPCVSFHTTTDMFAQSTNCALHYTLCTHYAIRGNLSNRPHQHNLTRTVTGFFLIIISITRNESNRQFCISFFTQPQIRRWEASCSLVSAYNRGDRHTDFSALIKIKIP